MNDSASYAQQPSETSLFQFHLDSLQPPRQNNHLEMASHLVVQPQPQNFHSLFIDTKVSRFIHNTSFASPQLKPNQAQPLRRKRFKSLLVSGDNTSEASSHNSSISLDNGSELKDQKSGENNDDEKDDELEDDDESDSDSDSNQESSEQNKKRGKYKIYTETEKATIINFAMKHGIQKTVEIFSSSTHKITKRKLKSWIESQYKVKGVKGRKTNDPNRDQTLYEWCLLFQREHGRNPTRKEATKKGLEISEDPSFQASKGWLDKFSRKYQIEFTPLKIVPPKLKKGTNSNPDSEPGSAKSKSDASGFEGISALMQTMQMMQPQQQAVENEPNPWNYSYPVPTANRQPAYDPESLKISSFFNNTAKKANMDEQGFVKGEGFQVPDQSGHYLPSVNNGFNYLYGFPLGYPPNYPTSYQNNLEERSYPNYISSNQFQSDIARFLKSGNSFEVKPNVNNHMKFEGSN